MLPLTVTKQNRTSDQGFTLLEIIAVLTLVGIMAAISGPGMIGFLRRADINSAQNDVQGLLKLAQRSAVRQAKGCGVSFPASGTSTNNMQISASCVPVDSNSTLENVQIRHNFDDISASFAANTSTDLFNFKGQTDDFINDDLVIVVSAQDNNNYQKCIVVSGGLGLVRTGSYETNNAATPVAASCTPRN